MGMAFMSNRKQYSSDEKKAIRSIVMRRSGFLFIIGLVLCLWWPADILHFYGGYMSIAMLLLFVPKRWYIIAAVIAIFSWHVLLMIIPFESGWDFTSLQYTDFWTVTSFLRNTFYNGWNPVFPWVAYFLLGMYLGRLNWFDKAVKLQVLISSVIVYVCIQGLNYMALQPGFNESLAFYITADYLPPTIPFMLGTASYGSILLVIMMWLGEKAGNTKMARWLASTGQMTLSHYILSLTMGMLVFAVVVSKSYTGKVMIGEPVNPLCILSYAIIYFSMSVLFSVLWKRKFNHGPFEMLMRKVSG